MAQKINSYYNRSPVKGIFFKDPTMTQQQFRDESDLNNIVDHNMRYKDPSFMTRMQLQGRVSLAKPIYGDFSKVGDYQQSIEIIRTAQEQFNCLPAKVRDRFNNNPAAMLAFVEDKSNYDECVNLGLFNKPINADIQTSKEAGSKSDVEPVSGSSPEMSA